MSKIQWKDYRKNVRYVVNAAFADLPELPVIANEEYKPTFTIKPYDHDDLISFERVFLEHYKDPTEYTLVEDVFEGDMKHWEAFKTGSILKNYYRLWREKADAMLVSQAMSKIVDTAFDESNKNSFQALKYLVERKKPSTSAKVGRPKKEKEEGGADDKLLLAAVQRLKE